MDTENQIEIIPAPATLPTIITASGPAALVLHGVFEQIVVEGQLAAIESTLVVIFGQ